MVFDKFITKDTQKGIKNHFKTIQKLQLKFRNVLKFKNVLFFILLALNFGAYCKIFNA